MRIVDTKLYGVGTDVPGVRVGYLEAILARIQPWVAIRITEVASDVGNAQSDRSDRREQARAGRIELPVFKETETQRIDRRRTHNKGPLGPGRPIEHIGIGIVSDRIARGQRKLRLNAIRRSEIEVVGAQADGVPIIR